MRAAYDALDERTKAEVEDLICEHSLTIHATRSGLPPIDPG
jgi:alpha-ketoglutarate-dependent 2,4-dichlorophenoxyacetate dioxygenase